MALIVTNVDQSRSEKSSAKVERPNTITQVTQGKINPLDSKESLQGRVTALTSRSEEHKEYARVLTLFALITGAVGIFIHLFLVVALGFLAGAAVCDIESNEAGREAEEAKSQLQSLQEKEKLVKAEFEKLLNGQSAEFEEHGMFKPEEFSAMIEQNDNYNFGAFSSYGDDYPYEIPEIEKNENEPLPNAIVRYFVEQAGNYSVRFARDTLQLDGAKAPQAKKNRHMCAFLKLLGDKNNHINTDINDAILEINPDVSLSRRTPGALTTDCPRNKLGKEEIGFKVEGEEVGLYFCESNGTHPIARFKTSRVVTVSAPDNAGNVHYTIKRTFTRI